MKQIINENDHFRTAKFVEERGTHFHAECKHCDYVQEQNRGNIISHLKWIHKIEY